MKCIKSTAKRLQLTANDLKATAIGCNRLKSDFNLTALVIFSDWGYKLAISTRVSDAQYDQIWILEF